MQIFGRNVVTLYTFYLLLKKYLIMNRVDPV